MSPPRRLACALGLLAAGLFAACAQPSAMPPAPAPSNPVSSPCDAQPAQFALGRVLDAGLTEQLRARTGAERVRVVRPGEMVTMEFDGRRLTVELDAGGRVLKLRCG
ncbi:hypothetical protein GCM10027034_12730 [Ramlibacter solisilvae]|uniref:Peptidase inhibitor I78 family protein n=1 Tax=Ramlibacter tataouinensis TaxID=94132 RepID=A0A127JWT7_9BURK|nr:I78 family peptidase inhibitor [Ramlibacter tataouinensis]AMO24457.1 hypothetical protein UC35_18465 [Ramlibacter tataouinensis]